METLKSLKTRISTVDTIMKATSAMKMVSTIKLSKINNLHKFAKDCSIYMQNVFVLLLQDALFNKILPHQHWLFPKTNCEELVVVLSPSTSFCGAFTQSITSTTKDFINKSNNINTVCCGDKIKIANAKILQLRDKNNVEEWQYNQ